MSEVYVVGQITIKNPAKWDEYRSRVPQTLEPWGAEMVFRGAVQSVYAGAASHPDIVVIRFASAAAADSWFASAAYQALIPVRQQAADVTLLSYST